MSFSYYGSFDSSQLPDWQTYWNGQTLDLTTNLPLGPPAAIAVEMTLDTPSKLGKAREIVVRHVIAIRAANRWIQYQNNTTGQ